ncbi:MAG: hypothetical protein HYU66_01660 [Armatimonadetes bacterium]|nr:hypothetical protein [Armatimonadota bacterium]
MNLLTEINLNGHAAPEAEPGDPGFSTWFRAGDPVWATGLAYGLEIVISENDGLAAASMKWQYGTHIGGQYSASTPPGIWYPCTDRTIRVYSDGGSGATPSLATVALDGTEVLAVELPTASFLFGVNSSVRYWQVGQGWFPDGLDSFTISYRGEVTRFDPVVSDGHLDHLDGRWEAGDNLMRDEAGVEYLVSSPGLGSPGAPPGWLDWTAYVYHRLVAGDWPAPTDTGILWFPTRGQPFGWAGNGLHAIRQVYFAPFVDSLLVSTDAGQSYNDEGDPADPRLAGLFHETGLGAIATADPPGRCLGARFARNKLIAVDHEGLETEVADQPDAAEALAFAAPDGTWRMLLIDGVTWTWYTAAVGDEANWTAGTPQTVGAALRLVAGAVGADRTVAFIGHNQAAGEVRVVWSAGLDAPFAAPVTVAAGIAAPYYLTQLPDGSLECGWLASGAWTRYRADHPGGPWTEVTP